MAENQGYLVVLVTTADAEFGRILARTLVEEGLAACAQVIPSGMAFYRWEGRVQAEQQTQLLIKTRAEVWPGLRERIIGLHSEEVPEVLAMPVRDGNPAYLRWFDDVVPLPAGGMMAA